MLMQQQGSQYLTCSARVAQKEALKKAENWECEKQILKEWSAAPLGQWKADLETRSIQPRGVGVPRHQTWQKETSVSRGKRWEHGTDHQSPGEELQGGFSQLYDHEAFGLVGKGSGKSSYPHLAKGKGKGKKGQQLAIEDKKGEEEGEEEEGGEEDEDKVTEALKKVRKCRDQTMSTLSNLEEALKKAAPQLSTKGKGGALATQLKLEKQLKQAKALLLKQSHDFKDLKKFLDDSAKALKSAKDDIKELKAIGNKAESVSGKSSSSKKQSKSEQFFAKRKHQQKSAILCKKKTPFAKRIILEPFVQRYIVLQW